MTREQLENTARWVIDGSLLRDDTLSGVLKELAKRGFTDDELDALGGEVERQFSLDVEDAIVATAGR